MQQELEHSVRVYRLPQERKGELEHLGGRTESGVATESAPRQAGALERVVEDDAVPFGDQQGLRVPMQRMEDLGDSVSREVA